MFLCSLAISLNHNTWCCFKTISTLLTQTSIFQAQNNKILEGKEKKEEERRWRRRRSKQRSNSEWDFILSIVVSTTTIGSISNTRSMVKCDPRDQTYARHCFYWLSSSFLLSFSSSLLPALECSFFFFFLFYPLTLNKKEE